MDVRRVMLDSVVATAAPARDEWHRDWNPGVGDRYRMRLVLERSSCVLSIEHLVAEGR